MYHRVYAEAMRGAVDALARGDHESLEEALDALDRYTTCLDRMLRRICTRICRRDDPPRCSCMAEEEYWELVDYISDKCRQAATPRLINNHGTQTDSE